MPELPARLDHVIADISQDSDNWWWVACKCAKADGPYPDLETAVDAYGDHLWDQAYQRPVNMREAVDQQIVHCFAGSREGDADALQCPNKAEHLRTLVLDKVWVIVVPVCAAHRELAELQPSGEAHA